MPVNGQAWHLGMGWHIGGPATPLPARAGRGVATRFPRPVFCCTVSRQRHANGALARPDPPGGNRGVSGDAQTLVDQPEQFLPCGIHRLGGLQVALRMGRRIQFGKADPGLQTSLCSG